MGRNLLDLSVDWQDFQRHQRNLPQTETLGRSSQSWAGTEDNEESNRALIIGCTERSGPKKSSAERQMRASGHYTYSSTTAAEKKETMVKRKLQGWQKLGNYTNKRTPWKETCVNPTFTNSVSDF